MTQDGSTGSPGGPGLRCCQPGEPSSTAEAGNGLVDPLTRIAVVMGCEPDDDDDLVEAVRLLVAERDEARALLSECRPWVSRGLMDDPAPTTDDWAVLARLDALLGGRDE